MAEWESWGSTSDTIINHSGVRVGTSWEVEVRAVTRNGIPGAWTSLGEVEIEWDTTPPPVPSDPVVTSSMGVVTVSWDGKTFDGGAMPKDFSHCVIYQDGISEPIGSVQLAGSGIDSYQVTGLTPGEQYSFRLASVDKLGFESNYSNYVSVTVVSVLDDPDIEDAIVDKVDDVVLQSGRNRVTYSSSTPSTDGKEVDGDTWFRVVGNDIVGQWNWFEGLGWLTKTVGHQVISAIDAGKITVGELNGGIIKTGTLGTDKLVVAPTSNLVIDPRFQNPELNAIRAVTLGNPDDQGKVVFSSANQRIEVAADTQTLTMLATTDWDETDWDGDPFPLVSNYIPVEPGQTYIFRARVQNRTNAPVEMDIGFARRDTSGAYLSEVSDWVDSPGADPGTTWTTIEYKYTVPGGTAYLLPYFYFDTTDSTTGTLWVDQPGVYRQTDAILLADGAITASKLAAGAITADAISTGSLDGVVITGATIRTAASGMRVEMSGTLFKIGDRPSGTEGVGWIFQGTTGYANVRSQSGAQIFTVEPNANRITLGSGNNSVRYDDSTKILTVAGRLLTGTRRLDPDLDEDGIGWSFYSDGSANVRYGSTTPFLTVLPSTGTGPEVTFDYCRVNFIGGKTFTVDGVLQLRDDNTVIAKITTGDSSEPRIELQRGGSDSNFIGYTGGTGAPRAWWFSIEGSVETSWALFQCRTELAAGRTYIQDETAGRVGTFGTTGSSQFYIKASNSLYLEATGNVRSTTARATTLGDSNRRPLFINPNGSLGIESSSRSSKLDIESHEFSVDSYLELDTKSWVWKEGVEGYADLLSRKAEGEDVDEEEALDQIISDGGLGRDYGMIAEEVEDAGFSEFVIHDEDGSCSGLRYDQLWLPLHSVAKQHHSRIAELEDELTTIKAQLASLLNGLTP